jgi:pyruvate/2-oxoglutarate dehydrogenase complex dihydrolipoamide dehydrogenase (E3) component
LGTEILSKLTSDKYKDKNINLISSSDGFLMKKPKKVNETLTKLFSNYQNITLNFNQKVIKINQNKVITDKYIEFVTDCLFLCNGFQPNTEFIPNSYLNNKYIKVNQYLQVNNYLYSGGDIIDLNNVN